MTTSAPIRKIHDVPIIEPYRVPKALPVVDPERIVRPIVVPVRQPERVRVW